MAIISGKARVEFNGIDLGELTFMEVTPSIEPTALPKYPIAVELTINVVWEPEALPLLTDICLQGQLGEHYKN